MDEKERIKELIELLRCNRKKVYLRNPKKKDGVSGVIFCDDYTYPIKYSLPVLIPPPYRRKYNKLRAVYEAIGITKWRASESDWIKHMRILHYIGLKNLVDSLSKSEGEKRILVIGCGWGWEIWALEKLLEGNYNIVGLDLSRIPLIYARKIARRRKNRNIVFGVGITDILPFNDNTFDAVIAMFGPLDHTEEYIKAFHEISRVLKRGGVFYFTVLNRFALDWLTKVIKSPRLYIKTLKKAKVRFVRVTIPTPIRTYRIPTHFYDIFEIKKILRLSRLKILKTWGIFSILSARFRKGKFGIKDKLLSYLELKIADRLPFKWLGRYIGVLAKRV